MIRRLSFGTAKLRLFFENHKRERIEVHALPDQNLLHLAKRVGLPLEGACECSLACSTCHVYFDPPAFKALPPASQEEQDMLDLAYLLTPTSRLGCQVKAGMLPEDSVVKLPRASRNMYVDKKS